MFEIYSDVTPFLHQIVQTAIGIKQKAADTQAKVAHAAVENQARIEQYSFLSIGVVAGLLGLLYVALFLVVKRAQSIIDLQEEEREKSQQRLSQAEKMASLGQMVAGIAHQLNTPLAFSENNVQMAKEAVGTLESDASETVQKIDAMLDDIYSGVGQMAEMVTHLQDFTRLDQVKTQDTDITATLRSVPILPEV